MARELSPVQSMGGVGSSFAAGAAERAARAKDLISRPQPMTEPEGTHWMEAKLAQQAAAEQAAGAASPDPKGGSGAAAPGGGSPRLPGWVKTWDDVAHYKDSIQAKSPPSKCLCAYGDDCQVSPFSEHDTAKLLPCEGEEGPMPNGQPAGGVCENKFHFLCFSSKYINVVNSEVAEGGNFMDMPRCTDCARAVLGRWEKDNIMTEDDEGGGEDLSELLEGGVVGEDGVVGRVEGEGEDAEDEELGDSGWVKPRDNYTPLAAKRDHVLLLAGFSIVGQGEKATPQQAGKLLTLFKSILVEKRGELALSDEDMVRIAWQTLTGSKSYFSGGAKGASAAHSRFRAVIALHRKFLPSW